MKHIAAYALLVLSGNDAPSKLFTLSTHIGVKDVEKVLKEAGIKGDSDKLAAMIESFKGKKFNEVSSLPSLSGRLTHIF